jgi:hypothetical protein
VVIALGVFALLGALPVILPAVGLTPPPAPTFSAGVHLLQAPPALRSVPLPAAARPVSPGLPTATLPGASESQEAVAVGMQDNWLRAMLHASFRSTFHSLLPRIVLSPGQLPTLVLTAAPSAPAYTIADLVQDKAAVLLPNGSALLQDNVFVASGARLIISSRRVPAIYLESRPRGSASIVGWGGSLAFVGTASNPLVIKGWNEADMTPAADTGHGRPYIREVAGRMTMTNVRVSFLGFWSGRTGGVAWTGLANHPSTGGATSSTFTDDTYGAFVARGLFVRFSGDLFESNQLDGFHVHRGTIGASATSSAAVRNGGNGFHVDRATLNTVLRDDVSQHNAANGFLVDGRPLVASASASGDGVAPGSGVRIESSAATGNMKAGILVEGGSGTLLSANEICARKSGIALRFGVAKAIIDGNDVRCGPRVGISLEASAPQTLMSGNAVSNARIGVLVANSGHVEIDHSRIAGARVFGITIRGGSSAVFGQDNVISGTGFRAVDVGADAPRPALLASNTDSWIYQKRITLWSYLLFHPLTIFWLSISFLIISGALWSRRRRLPPHPYYQSTRWVDPEKDPERLAHNLIDESAGWAGHADSPSPDREPAGVLSDSRPAGSPRHRQAGWPDSLPPEGSREPASTDWPDDALAGGGRRAGHARPEGVSPLPAEDWA